MQKCGDVPKAVLDEQSGQEGWHQQPVPPWSSLPLWAKQRDVGVLLAGYVSVLGTGICVPHPQLITATHLHPQLIYSKPIAMGFSQGLGARVGVVPVLLVLYCDSLVPSFWLFQCFAVWSLFPSFLPAFPLGSSGAARCQPGRLLHGSARTESRRRQGWAAASLGVPCTSVTSATCSSRASPMGGNPLPAPGMAAVLREGVMLPAQRFHRAQRGNLSGSL